MHSANTYGGAWSNGPPTSLRIHAALRQAAIDATIAPMDIVLNGEPRTLAAGITLTSLLEAEGLAGRRVAVEVNGTIVPRGRHDTHTLAQGDRVEIVHALGGG